MNLLIVIIKFLLIIVPILLVVAVLTLLERKIMAAYKFVEDQMLLVLDIATSCRWIKIIDKRTYNTLKSNKWLFLLSPVLFLL